MKVAIQGGQASFHDVAARRFFAHTDLQLVECQTFRQEFAELSKGCADFVVMAVENTLAGSLLSNYALVAQFDATIVGEIYLQIKQNLMALPGQAIEEIRTVRSHPIALQQCSEFLEKQTHMRALESADTADSARQICEQRLTGTAAVASMRAAELYDLTVLVESIENIKDNYTRFWILARHKEAKHEGEKASLVFHVKHEVGALARVLNTLCDHSLNLGLIQSVPIPGRPDEYAFHVDIEWNERKQFESALPQIKQETSYLYVLGQYKAGEKPYARSFS